MITRSGGGDPEAPVLRGLRAGRGGGDVRQAGEERAHEDRQRLARERLLLQEELDDRGREAGQRELAGADDPRSVDARQQALLAEPSDRGARPLALRLPRRLEHADDLFEHVHQLIFLEGRRRGHVGPQVERGDEAEVHGRQLEGRALARQVGEDAVRVRGHEGPTSYRRSGVGARPHFFL
jgi:hypothetical protein